VARSSCDDQTISGLTRNIGFLGSSSRATSSVMMRRGSPTWMAASPIPGASYMVFSIRSMKRRAASSTPSTAALFCRRIGSGIETISRLLMLAAT
jgi:hypothetical protein